MLLLLFWYNDRTPGWPMYDWLTLCNCWPMPAPRQQLKKEARIGVLGAPPDDIVVGHSLPPQQEWRVSGQQTSHRKGVTKQRVRAGGKAISDIAASIKNNDIVLQKRQRGEAVVQPTTRQNRNTDNGEPQDVYGQHARRFALYDHWQKVLTEFFFIIASK